MQRARWFLGQGPLGRVNASLGNEGKLFRWVLDRNRKQVVYTGGDLTRFDPTNTGPGGGVVNASSGNNEVWRGVFASATPTWTKLVTQFGPASTGVVPGLPINCSFSADPLQDDYIIMPGFYRTPTPNPSLRAPIAAGDGPGALVSIAGGGFGNNAPDAWPDPGFIFVFTRGVSVGGQQEIIQYNNKVVDPGGTSGTLTIVSRRALGTTGGTTGWPSGAVVYQLGMNAYNDSLNPNGPIGDYGCYVLNPTVNPADGWAHWGYPGFIAPPSGYGGDDQSSNSIMDWLPDRVGLPAGTKSTYRFFHSGSNGFLIQKLDRTTLPGTWTETIQGQGISFINETMTPTGPATITLNPPATNNLMYPPTGGLLMIGASSGGPGSLEAVRYSAQIGGVLTISQRGAAMCYQPASGVGPTVRQNTTAQAHAGGGNQNSGKAVSSNVALNGFNCEKAQLALDAYGRYLYSVAYKGSVEGYNLGPSGGFGAPHPFQPHLARVDLTVSPPIAQCVAQLPDEFDFGIGLHVPFDTGQDAMHIGFDPLNRLVIVPNQANQHNGVTDGWYLYHVDAPTRIFNLATAPGWEREAGPYPAQGNSLIWDDFRNCGLWIGSSAADSGTDTYYRYAGGPTTAAPATLGLSSLTPTSGFAGSACDLSGTLFGASQGTSRVNFGSGTATPSTWSATAIRITIPALAAGVYNVSVTVGVSTSNVLPFTILTNAPTITSITPSAGPVLTQITIVGTNYGVNQLVSSLTIGGAFATVVSWSDTQIVALVPASLGIGAQTVQITTVNGTVSSTFTVTPPAPTATMVFEGVTLDKVGQGNTALAPDGALDGVFTVTIRSAGGTTVTSMRLDMVNAVGTSIGTWDTTSASVFWILGVARDAVSAYLNNAVTMAVNFSMLDGGTVQIYASDLGGAEFLATNTATLLIGYADGTSSTTTLLLGAPPPPPPTGTIGITLLPYGRGEF